ncbi:MAG: 4-oxalocrotonate tautomerase [Hyphomicrobium sp.]|jgi:hypothetical protein
MPLTLTLTKGVLPDGAESQAIAQITDAFLAAHSLSGNKVMTPNVTAHVNILPKGATFAGGKPVEGAWIETKTPSFALADRSAQENFFKDATRILHELSGGKLPVERIWSNGVHAVDGTWNINGAPMTNAEIGAAVANG